MIGLPFPGAGVPWRGCEALSTPAAVGWKGVRGGSLGLLLWVLLLAGILQTLYGIGAGGGGASHLRMTFLVPGISESPEVSPVFQHSVFQFY